MKLSDYINKKQNVKIDDEVIEDAFIGNLMVEDLDLVISIEKEKQNGKRIQGSVKLIKKMIIREDGSPYFKEDEKLPINLVMKISDQILESLTPEGK